MPRDDLVRRLALQKVRELRASGLSYREIGRRFGSPPPDGEAGAPGSGLRLPPDGDLPGEGGDGAPSDAVSRDQRDFLQALDALDDGLAFFDLSGGLVAANRALERLWSPDAGGEGIREEIDQFVFSLCGLLQVRGTPAGNVEQLASREIRHDAGRYSLRGSYVGFDLFRRGRVLLVQLERVSSTAPTEEAIRNRFGLTRQEARIARLLAEGRSNSEIAASLYLSEHTTRNYTRRVLDKLGVRSRAQVGPRLAGR